VALAGALLAICAPGASALLAHLRSGRALSYMPSHRAARKAQRFDALFTNLDYNGGPVMASNTNYTIYWDPAGAPQPYAAGYKTGVNKYLEDLANDSGGTQNVDSVSAQYNDSAGEFASYNSHYGGTFVDPQPYPVSGCPEATFCLTDEQIQTELKRFVAEKELPADLAHEYFLLTPPEVESCFEEEAGFVCSAGVPGGEFCAYHGNAPLPEGHELIYSNDPYVLGIVGCDEGNHPNGPSDAALQGGLSHEHNESITDPEPNNAWTDFGSTPFGEIGDKCGGELGASLGTFKGSSYNQLINGDHYSYQEEWSNQGHQCLQRLSFRGERPTATFIQGAGAGNEVKFDATGSSAPGGVHMYNWQFNANSAPTETSSPRVNHVFPAPGTYIVALTIFASDGTSIGTMRSVQVNAAGRPTAAFSETTPTPTIGLPLAFDGSATTGSHAVTSYSWDFGDGTPLQGGVAPTHTYTAAGSYEVTLMVIDSTALTAGVSHTITVEVPASGGTPPGPTAEGPALTAAPAAVGAATGTVVPPATVAALTASVALAGATAQVKGAGQTSIRLTCTGTASTCGGRLSLTVKLAARGRRRRTVTIASVSFSAPAGRTSTVALKLNALGRTLLRAAHGHLTAQLGVSKTVPAPAQSLSRALRLSAVPARRR
jgi:PKD repeat protein